MVKARPQSPAHHETPFELSNLDQIYNWYADIALFYGPCGSQNGTRLVGTENVAAELKSALEELLGHCPWAGGRLRVNEKERRLEVEYHPNDQGVQFVSARVGFTLGELGDITSPDPSLDLLFARLPDDDDDAAIMPPLVAIQVTRFQCGSFTLALKSHHALMDGYGAAVFMQNLCSIARGAGLTTLPDNVSRRERMKPRDPPLPALNLPHFIKKGATDPHLGVARRYSFRGDALEDLRRTASRGNTSCSRYQALAGFLWMAKAKSLDGLPPDQELDLRVSVNVRERIVPSLTRGYLGNAIFFAIARATVKELQEKPLSFAVNRIKSAIATVTPECVQSQTDLIEILGMGTRLDYSSLGAPSLVALPFYDSDCGWGAPIYCGRPSHQLSNVFTILEGMRCCNHPPSWNVLAVFLSEKERLLFEEAIELRKLD